MYFITISLLTAGLVLSLGLLVSLVDKSNLSNRFYQIQPIASSQFYFEMMDQVIPGDMKNETQMSFIEYVLSSFFDIQLIDKFSYITSELPIKGYKQNTPSNYNLNTQHPNDLGQLSSELSEKVPVFTMQTTQKPEVFVYHTHSRESWISDKGENENDKSPFHESYNITLVGKHFSDQLERIGIPVHYNKTDHDQILVEKELTRADAYAISANTVANALQNNPNIDYIFDFHRDAVDRKYTTTTINGLEYAKIMFVIGQQNQNWRENYAFAEKIQKILDERYPGLCRTIATYPASKSNNGKYNQAFSNHALTVEIGGVNNTLEESLRTVNLLADAFAEVYLEAVPVMSQEGSEK